MKLMLDSRTLEAAAITEKASVAGDSGGSGQAELSEGAADGVEAEVGAVCEDRI